MPLLNNDYESLSIEILSKLEKNLSELLSNKTQCVEGKLSVLGSGVTIKFFIPRKKTGGFLEKICSIKIQKKNINKSASLNDFEFKYRTFDTEVSLGADELHPLSVVLPLLDKFINENSQLLIQRANAITALREESIKHLEEVCQKKTSSNLKVISDYLIGEAAKRSLPPEQYLYVTISSLALEGGLRTGDLARFSMDINSDHFTYITKRDKGVSVSINAWDRINHVYFDKALFLDDKLTVNPNCVYLGEVTENAKI